MSSPEPLCEALAGFTLVKFLVFYILANRFPNHRTARSSKPEYSVVRGQKRFTRLYVGRRGADLNI